MEIQHFRESEMKIQHWSHKHPLILIREEKDHDFVVIVCNLCEQRITTGSSFSSSYYKCRSCSFNLHKLCAKLPTEIKHPVHPEVTLTLRYEYFSELRCESCDKKLLLFAYVQRPISSLPTPAITSADPEEDPEGAEMDDESLSGSSLFQGAEMDDESLSGSEYYPDESLSRSEYYPDESLSGLSLFQGAEMDNKSLSESLTNRWKYALDIQCAAKTMSFKHEFHEHPLTPMLRLALFECHACGTVHKIGLSYMCNTCGFWIHEDCALLPTTFTHTGHVHPLILGCCNDYFYRDCNDCQKRLWQNNIDENFIVRGERFVRDLWVYECATCEFYVHVNCLTKTKFKNSKTVIKPEDLDVTNLIHLPLDGSVNLIDQFMKQISLGLAEEDNKGEAEEEELNHFSHNHPLILFVDAYSDDQLCSSGSELSIPIPNNEQNNKKICNACVRPILGPFYSCRSHNNLCNFFLHKWCAELPKEIQHPCHPHPLSLMRMRDPKRLIGSPLHNCKCCGKISNGLGFRCTHKECNYFLKGFYCIDVKCASLPSSIVHELHEHPLRLRSDCATRGCVACDDERRWEFTYGCDHCSFNLHHDCALLPRTIKHRYDKHPFTLTYGPVQDGPEEYICEFCEKDMDPKKRWFYHCNDCDQSACARCIYYKEENNTLSNIKFPENKNGNRHPFTKAHLEKNNCLCDYCHTEIYSRLLAAYTCANCKTILHEHCVLLHAEDKQQINF